MVSLAGLVLSNESRLAQVFKMLSIPPATLNPQCHPDYVEILYSSKHRTIADFQILFLLRFLTPNEHVYLQNAV